MPDEMPVLPLVPERMQALIDQVTEEFGASPDLGATEVSLDRTALILRWYGEPPVELIAMIDPYRDEPFEIRLVETRFRQADLTAEAGRILREHPGVVTVTGPRNEGDGVTVGIDPTIDPRPDAATLSSLGITSEFPLFPESVAQPIPIAG